MEWNSKECLKLIAAYRQHQVLWNPWDQFHLHRDKKQEAWVAIGHLFGCRAEEVRKKMHNLLRSYSREKIKAKRLSKSQNGDLKAYTSTWYAYNRMNFLDNKFDMRNLHNVSDEECDSFKPDDQGPLKSEPDSLREVLGCVEAVYDVQAVSENPKEHKQVELVEYRKHQEPPAEVTMKRSMETQTMEEDVERRKIPCTSESVAWRNQTSADDCLNYGQYIERKLRKYDRRTKSLVEYHVNNILVQADMGFFGQGINNVCNVCKCEK